MWGKWNKILLMAVVSATLSACDSEEKGDENSTPEAPKEIVMAGSDTEMPLVQEMVAAFKKTAGDKHLRVEGGGSSTGIRRFIDGEIAVANSSRNMWPEEIDEAEHKGMSPTPVVFGLDAVAIVTNPRLGVDSLSLFELRSIFRGEIKNWKQVGGPDLTITLYGRNNTSGTYAYIQERVVQGTYCPSMKELEGNAQIVDAVIADKSGIGYVGAGFLMDVNGKPRSDMWAMFVYIEGDNAYSPYQVEAVKNGNYPLTRPLYHFINGKPDQLMHDYFRFALGDEGQEIVKKFGYFPISDFYREVNRKKGIATQ
jgi:phosphate transport system substrate-binding protein